MKNNEELNALKEEIEALNKKLAELNEEEMKEVIGGIGEGYDVLTCMDCDDCGFDAIWRGDYMNGEFYDCPRCLHHSFHGVGYYW